MGASPHVADATVNRPRPPRKTALRPQRSASRPSGHEQGGEHERVARQHPRHVLRADVGERRLDGAERHEQDLGVEEHHEDAEPGDKGERRPRECAGWAALVMMVEIIN